MDLVVLMVIFSMLRGYHNLLEFQINLYGICAQNIEESYDSRVNGCSMNVM